MTLQANQHSDSVDKLSEILIQQLPYSIKRCFYHFCNEIPLAHSSFLRYMINQFIVISKRRTNFEKDEKFNYDNSFK